MIAREPADLAVTLVGETAELAHVAHHQPAPRIDAREHLDPGLHRARIGVVRVVDDPGATRRGFELQSARNRAHCGKPGAHARRARRRPRSRRPPRTSAFSTLCAPARCSSIGITPPGARSLKRVTKPLPSIVGVDVARGEVRRLRDSERRDAAARHAAPQRRELVVGIDHRGGGRVESGDHLAFGARDALEAAESFEMLGAGVGDEADRGARELHQVGDFTGAIGADLDHRVAMRGVEPMQRERHADVIVEIAAGRERGAAALENGRGHLLDRGLAVAAGDADDGHRKLRAPGGGRGR